MSKKSFIKPFLLLMTLSFILIAACPVFASSKALTVTLKNSTTKVSKTYSAGTDVTVNAKYGSILLLGDYVTFYSSNDSVASVSDKGVISARKSGTAVVTARYKKRSAKITVNVKGSSSDSLSSGSSSSSSLRTKLVQFALSRVGVTPYVYAGNSLTSGTDCSGFIQLIYSLFGISTPRSASEFYAMRNCSFSELEPGDVVCYKYGGHVAIYIGNERVVHAKGSNYGTVTDSMWYGTPTGYVKFIK